MLAIAPGWELYVERGPDWLIVKIESMDAGEKILPLAEIIWSLDATTLNSSIGAGIRSGSGAEQFPDCATDDVVSENFRTRRSNAALRSVRLQ